MEQVIRRLLSASLGTACVLATALVASPALALPPDARRHPMGSSLLSHERLLDEILESLWAMHRATQLAIRAGDLEAVHRGERALIDALQSLDESGLWPPESVAERAQEVLDECFEIADALHDAAEERDVARLENLLVRLQMLLVELPTLFEPTDGFGLQASACAARSTAQGPATAGLLHWG